MEVVGIVIGATAVLLMIRVAVPQAVKESPAWLPVLVAALVIGALAGDGSAH